jgi:hypothetical protein
LRQKQKAISSFHLGSSSSSSALCQKNSENSLKWMRMTGLQFAAPSGHQFSGHQLLDGWNI